MALMVATQMSEKKEESARYCTYSSLKVDAELIPLLKIAAATRRTTVQELASDILNDALAKQIKQSIKRLPPPPKKKKPKS